jgi:tetratricopeptide (TPR) repeat protein
MKHTLSAALLVLGAAAGAAAAAPSLDDARTRWLKGNYDEAAEQYTELAKDAKLKAEATVGLSRALQSQGEYDKALAVVDDALKDAAKDAQLLARRAEVLYLRGRWDDAEKAADDAVAASKDTEKGHFLARWVRAQVYRDRGDIDKADAEFRWFVKTYTARSNANNDIKDPDELLIVGQAGSENARWHKLSKQFTFILQEVYGDAEKYDKALWQAEYLEGVLLFEKYNRPEAKDSFEKALTLNPRAAEALVGKGVMAVDKFEFEDAEKFAGQALKINPQLGEALRLMADIHLAAGDIEAALKEVDKALAVNPRDERNLARKAACFLVINKKADYDAVIKDVEKNDAKPAVFYYELGQRVEDRRLYDEAEKDYKKAAELQPMLPWPTPALGMLYMREGREEDAADLLDKGFKADPFNVRVNNSRKVLKHLKDYETLKTAHFVLKFDPKTDGPLAHYMADYLEKIYADLADKFKYQPKGPILIEVFNSHEMFSGRVTALPDLHTVGASTGPMIAMASPVARGVPKVFNWARVIRHETVHVFNLDQTHMLCPHWLTEGLAVGNEGFPRQPLWTQLLLERVPKGDLYDLDTIDLGFVRPRSQLDWAMAYCQSQLYVDFMKSEYGADSPGKMLAAYADGLGTAAALERACKVDKAKFEKKYREYLEDVVKKIGGKPAAPERSLDQLKADHAKDPDDADTTAALAEAMLNSNRAEARKLAEEAAAKKKGCPRAAYVLARLAHQAGDAKQERELLEAALDKADPDLKVLAALADLYYDASEFAKAAELSELGRKAVPYEPKWLARLARIYAQTGDTAKQIDVLKDLVPTDADDLDDRKRLARLLLEAEKYAEAETYARQALEINVGDADAREALVKALKGQKKDDEADRVGKLLEGK